MEIKESAQMLRQMVIENGLPKTDMALFGVKCLYCGKSDRIRQLETPDELYGKMDLQDYETYAELWAHMAPPGRFLGICKFCNNLLKLDMEEGKTDALST